MKQMVQIMAATHFVEVLRRLDGMMATMTVTMMMMTMMMMMMLFLMMMMVMMMLTRMLTTMHFSTTVACLWMSAGGGLASSGS